MRFRGIIATEAPCKIDKPEGLIITECLSIYKGMPLPDKIPLLDCHNRGLSCTLGHAERLRVERIEASGVKLNAITGEIIFSRAYAGTQAEVNVIGGHLWGLSVGYEAHRIETIEPGEKRTINGMLWHGGKRVISRFEPLEVSLTPLPRDKNCKIIIINQEQ
jgi:hypothetical protein